MPFKTTFLLLAILVSSFAFFNSGCSGKTESGFGSVDIPSTAPDAPPDDDDGGGGGGEDPLAEINANYFWAGLAPDEPMFGYTHATTGFSDICGVSKAATSSQDVECILEVPEGDLFGLDLKLTYNVPKGAAPGGAMCRYLVRTPYWFFDKEIGVGPVNMAVTVTQSSDPTATQRDCVVDGVSADCSTVSKEVTFTFDDSDKATPTCAYGTCCFGKYTFSQITINPSGDPSVVTAPASGDWSGTMSSCLGGPAKSNWETFWPEGFPRGLQEYTGDGFNEKYTVTSISAQTVIRTESREIANYYTPALNSHTGFSSPTVSTLPYFLDPIDDRSGTPLAGNIPGYRRGNDSYLFECYDPGYELMHRVRIYVREWNTMEEYIKYIVSSGTDGDPDVNGTDGVDCDGSDGASGPFCNDFLSLDDYINIDLAGQGIIGYNTSDPDNRTKFFPKNRP